MDSRDTSLFDKMTESAGELLFEAGAHDATAGRATIKELAHHLGRLYGETIRACREHGGLLDEVQTTFMCGMAISPNFGREEVLRDPGAEAREEEAKKAKLMFPPSVGQARKETAEAILEEAKPCFKCQGSGNMGFTTYVACDAC